MAAILVVDGYNAIYAIPETREKLKKGLERARNAIVAIAREYARSSGYITDIKVVFDGDSRYRYLDALELSRGRTHVFSETGEGDDTIIETVRKYSSRGKVVLASNDNYVRNNSRAYNAVIISVEELLRKKKKDEPAGSKTPDKEISKNVRDKITREYEQELGL